MRDICDVALVLRVERAQQEMPVRAMMAVQGGVEYVDPVAALMEELTAEPVRRADADLRAALGLST